MVKIVVEIVKIGRAVLKMMLTVGDVDGTTCSFRSIWIFGIGDRSWWAGLSGREESNKQGNFVFFFYITYVSLMMT